jgi:C1A family cysteine protease
MLFIMVRYVNFTSSDRPTRHKMADSPQHHGGHLKDRFDARDHYYVPDPSTQPPSKIDLRQDDAPYTSAIYDQLKTNTCVANATAAAFWYEEKAGRRTTSWGQKGPSRLFIYWLARGAYKNEYLDMAFPSDSGTQAREAMKALAKCGVCSEETWPFDTRNINIRPSDQAFKEATHHAINSFYRLDSDRPDSETHQLTTDQKDKIGAAVLANLKKCLTEQYPVVFGLWYRLLPSLSFDETQRPFVLRDVWNMPGKSLPRHVFLEDLPNDLKPRLTDGQIVSSLGGHTVLAIGYDDDRQQVLVQNSRGADWGGSGTFWMPYSWIIDCAATNDFWTIRGGDTLAPKRWDEVHQEILM